VRNVFLIQSDISSRELPLTHYSMMRSVVESKELFKEDFLSAEIIFRSLFYVFSRKRVFLEIKRSDF
jgi:hypothetical protein